MSKTGAGGKPMSNFLPLFQGKDVIIANTKNINSFGTYKVINMQDYSKNPDFIEVTLTNYDSSGELDHGAYYIFSEFQNAINGGGDLNLTYSPPASQKVWTITHNLGKNPSVSVADSAGTWVVGEVEYLSNNELTITFNSSFSGVAYLN